MSLAVAMPAGEKNSWGVREMGGDGAGDVLEFWLVLEFDR